MSTTTVTGYGNLEGPVPGMSLGTDNRFEGHFNPSGGATFNFGDGVFAAQGDSLDAMHGDSTNTKLKFLGVAALKHIAYRDGTTDCFPALTEVDVQVKGMVTVAVPTAIGTAGGTANEKAYLINIKTDANYGKFTTAATDGTNSYYDTGCYFRTNPKANTIAGVSSPVYVVELELTGGLK